LKGSLIVARLDARCCRARVAVTKAAANMGQMIALSDS